MYIIFSFSCKVQKFNNYQVMASATLVSSSKCYDGHQNIYTHHSEELKCEMQFSVYLPPQVKSKKCPVLFFLSGKSLIILLIL